MALWIEVKEIDRNDIPPNEFIERQSFCGNKTKKVRQWSYIPKLHLKNVTTKKIRAGEKVLEICKIGKQVFKYNNTK